MNTPKNVVSAARRVADKRKRAEQAEEQTALQRFVAGLDPEYTDKLRHDAIRSAHERLRESRATPEEVVAEAGLHFAAQVRFLMGASS
jgi:hypothetical protein